MRRLDRREDSGFTLVEVIVSAALFVVVGVLVNDVYVRVAQSTARTSTRLQDTSDVRIAMDEMTRTLREAVEPDSTRTAFTAYTPTSVTFYSNVNTLKSDGTYNGPELVSFALTGAGLRQNLVETVTPAVTSAAGTTTPYTWPGSGTRTRVLATNLLPPPTQPLRGDLTCGQSSATGGPIFVFIGANDPDSCSSLPTSTTSAGSLQLVDRVAIYLSSAGISRPAVTPTTIEDRVAPPGVTNVVPGS